MGDGVSQTRGSMGNEKTQCTRLRLFVLYGLLLLLHFRRIEMHGPDTRDGFGLTLDIGV
jgi:hypothetical protein